MIIIYGGSRTGKTKKALSLLNEDTKSIYYALDFDRTIKSSKNLEVKLIKNCFETDIRFFLSERKRIIKDSEKIQIVIDPINLLNNIGVKHTLEKSINILKKLESDFNVEIILVVNILFHFPQMANNITNIENVQLIETIKNDELKPFHVVEIDTRCALNRCISCRWYIYNIFPDMMPEICKNKGRKYSRKVNGNLNKVRTV